MDLSDFVFMIYRILPFIMVSYFVISSFLGNDFSGFLVFLGILFSSSITIIISNALKTQIWNSVKSSDSKETDEAAGLMKHFERCNIIMIGDKPLSFLPLSTHTYSFVLGYFIMVLNMSRTPFLLNWILLSVLSLLIVYDIYYNLKACAGIYVWIPVIVGFVSGLLWAIIIGKKNHMIPKKANTTCSMNSSKNYKCTLKKNGELLK
jgi:hypothetical protein